MKKIQILQGVCAAGLAVALMGCASLNSNDLRGAALLHFDRAPQSLDPQLSPDQVRQEQADAHFTMGESYAFNGESVKAIEQFRQALLADPDSTIIRLRLAAEYVRSGLVSEAIEAGESAVKFNPNHANARMLLGGLYTSVKLFDQAAEQFAEAYRLDSSNEEAAVFQGAVIAEKGDYKKAIQFFENLAKRPNFGGKDKAHYYLGKINYEMKGPSAKTISELQKALVLNPQYREAAMTLAQIYESQNQRESSEKVLMSYQDKNGPDPDMARLLARNYLEKKDYLNAYKQLEVINSFEDGNPSTQMQMALLSIELKQNDRAISLLEQILKSSPELDKARFYLGALYLEKSDYEKALEHLRVIPPASNYFEEARIQVGQIFKQAQQHSKAEDVYRQSVKERSDSPQLVAALAAFLDSQRKYSEARDVLEKGREEFPQDTQISFFLGSIYDRLGKPEESMDMMRVVITIDPDHVQALNYLAYTMAERGENLSEAKVMAQKALRLSPNDPYIMDTLGWIHFKNGNFKEAQRLIEAAYRQKPDEAIIVEHLGDIYVKTESWSMAMAMYQQAQVLEKDEDKAQKILEKMASIQDQKQPTRRLPASVPSP